MDGAEEDEREIYPESQHPPRRARPPEEGLLEAGPGPVPILVILLIVGWLWAPFVASVVFLVVILGIFAAVENPSDLYSVRGITAAGEALGLRRLQALVLGRAPGGLWDASVVAKLWNQVLDSSPALQGVARDGLAVAATQVDWVETGDAHVFRADVPGLRKEEVKVELEGESVLQISGQRSQDDDDGESRETWHRVERSRGRFLRRFQLPLNAKVDEVQAKVEHGVLTVTVPKIKKQPVLSRPVEVQ